MLYLIYTCGFNHTYESMELVAIATTKIKALKLVKQHAVKNGWKLSDWTQEFLAEKMQTQGSGDDNFKNEYEYIIHTQEKNILL